MQEIKLPYGLKNGELVHISEVEQGVACQCICPTCHSPLIARKGENNVHHFSHQNIGECQGALETSLHLAAKKIFEQSQYIVLPLIHMGFNYRGLTQSGHNFSFYKSLVIFEESKYRIDKVLLEPKLQQIIPDIIVYIQNKPLLLEMYVTHAIDRVKLQKIQQLGYATIEVNLSAHTRNFHYDELKEMLVETSARKRWVYNPKIDQYNVNLSKAIDIKPIVYADRDDMHSFVENCPRNIKIYRGKSYADIAHNCWKGCEYFLDFLCHGTKSKKDVFCGGRNKITSLKELKQFIIR